MNKRLIVKQAIEEGGATRESLMEAAGVNSKGLASLFTYLRWSGICPMKQDDGTYKLVSEEEWEEFKSNRTSAGPTTNLTPAERLEKAEKRQGRAASALDKATKRKEANPDDKLYELQSDKAELELQIAELLVGRAEVEVTNSSDEATDPIIEEEVEDTEDTEDTEDAEDAEEDSEKDFGDNDEDEFL